MYAIRGQKFRNVHTDLDAASPLRSRSYSGRRLRFRACRQAAASNRVRIKNQTTKIFV